MCYAKPKYVFSGIIRSINGYMVPVGMFFGPQISYSFKDQLTHVFRCRFDEVLEMHLKLNIQSPYLGRTFLPM